jgi:transcriptional regulator with XRE-family HTH domain
MQTWCDTVAAPTRSELIMGVAPPPTRREELAEFLRHLRERTAPEALGIDAEATRRRTPGLRREEVCQLAGVGLSWYTWLEQGREITPSPSVLDSLALVFELSGAEREHLFDLAGVPVPTPAGNYPTTAPPGLAEWVAALDPVPAYLTNPRTDVLAHNRAAATVIHIPPPGPDGVPNLLWSLFTESDPPIPDGGSREQTARSTLARFRAAHARRYGDPRFAQLIRALSQASPRFRELWPRHEVLDSQLGTKVIEHPRLGTLTLHHLQSIPTTDRELRLTQFVPADEATRAALARATA